MRKALLMLIVLALVISTVPACSITAGDSIKALDPSDITNKEIKAVIDSWLQRNGAYLLQYKGKNGAIYLFLNSSNLEQDRKATELGSFRVQDVDNEMHIYYEEKEAEKSSNIMNKIVYKMVSKHAPSAIRIFKNDIETSFEAISIIGD